MPWWAGVVVALLSYLMLHALATAPMPQAATPGQVGNMLVSAVFRSLAHVGQYLVPVLCVVGAGLSAYRRRTRQALMADVTARRTSQPFADLSWQQFEQCVGEMLRQRGYQVDETGGGGADGGIDLVLRRNGERHVVQCKQWRAYKVGVGTVRELYGVMAERGAAGGFVVTSGRFTAEALTFAQGRNIELVDGARLQEWIGAGCEPVPPRKADAAPVPSVEPAAAPSASPSCPSCGGAMALRQAKRGPQAGRAFWGCQQFPSCRGTRVKDEVRG